MAVTALIDADSIVYEAAFAAQETVEFSPDVVVSSADLSRAREVVEMRLQEIEDELGSNEQILCLSDGYDVFRRDFWPEYKRGRQYRQRPLAWARIREYMISTYRTVLWDRLEADDVLGILATGRGARGEKIIVSEDKDLLTVPGLLYRADKVVEVSQEGADWFHLFQTLMGDRTDGYPGCPGVGPKKAEKILDKNLPPHELWERVVEQFAAAGLPTAYALTQARCAYILRAQNYRTSTKEIVAWTPPVKAFKKYKRRKSARVRSIGR